ncbi:hypothetical protein BX616_003372 [Lobosporangium transversale]|uniref:Mitochondrial carrier domain-containing protein n=1 Tax=Lobosporangium transversale TaxID=64571 RepID=A0A1Y2GIT3_9FUNG|nr:mitochondrial carrier domain-containing protein [Lobosporangium transversale]KAF9916594.1 hypothetical protein BX616_003372 [Lobosporangium transversale]ORZ12086.1 mitochondrial carrier domain-containing protein [Lobosporangium transversale]|eukprot:XP_021879951.1 mitochondrial carrier domain-containing protein [Lobosporangium transversale]
MVAYELPPIGHALSGGVAAALANMVIYPLDMATTRVQSQSTKDPSESSVTGLIPLQKTASASASASNETVELIEFKRPPLPDSTSSSSSTTATSSDITIGEDGRKKKITKTTITTTTTTHKVASSSSLSLSSSTSRKVRYTSVLDAIRKTYATEGFSALYSGLASDTVATLTSNFVYFYVYMALRQYKEHRRQSGQLSTVQELFLGAEAGIISRFFTAPIHVVTTRQQVMGSSLEQEGKGATPKSTTKVSARSIIQEIYAQDGITGFWAGYAPTVILSINPSITYFLFETFKKWILQQQLKTVSRTNPSPSKSVLAAAASLTSLQVFLISAFSKAIASFLTYPLILTKTKLQTKSEEENQVDEEASIGIATVDSKTGAMAAVSASTASGGSTRKTVKKSFNGISDVFRTVIRDKGIAGLYTGCQGQVVKGFFSFGLMYMIKDRVVAWMLTLFLSIHNMRNRVTSS